MAIGHWLKNYMGNGGVAESGGGTSGNLVVTASVNFANKTATADKTYNDFADALPNVITIAEIGGGYSIFEVNSFSTTACVMQQRVEGTATALRLVFRSDGTIEFVIPS